MAINEEGGISTRVREAEMKKKVAELLVPGPWGLFKAIDGFVKTAYMSRVLWVNETGWLSHVNILMKSAMEKCIVHIEKY